MTQYPPSVDALGRALLDAEWPVDKWGPRCFYCGEEVPDHVELCPVSALINHITGEGRAGRDLDDWECDWCGAHTGCAHFIKMRPYGPPAIRDPDALLAGLPPYDSAPG